MFRCIKLIFIISFSTIFGTLPAKEPIAVASSQKAPPVSVLLEPKGPFEISGIAKIESLNVGEDNLVRLLLKNRTGSNVRLGKANTTCRCVSVTSECLELIDGSECEIEVQLRPDRDYSDKIWRQSISFAPDVKQGSSIVAITVTIVAGLSGVFTVEPSRLLFIASVSDGIAKKTKLLRKQVSVSVTPPIQLENLKITGPDFLNLFDVVIAPDEKSEYQGSVVLEIDAANLPSEGWHGHMELADKKSGQRRMIAISAIRRDPIQAIPSTMVVRPLKQDELWVAYGMVINKSEELQNADNEDTPLFISVKSGGDPVPIKLLQRGPRLQRFRLDFDQELFEKLFSEGSQAVCQFDVHWGSQKVSCKAALAFLNRPLSSEQEK